MTVTCDGFKNLALDAEVHFPTSLIVKAGRQDDIVSHNKSERAALKQSSRIEQERTIERYGSNQVIGYFSTIIESWDDLLISMSLPKFEITGLKDYSFELDDVVLDVSSIPSITGALFMQLELKKIAYMQSAKSMYLALQESSRVVKTRGLLGWAYYI